MKLNFKLAAGFATLLMLALAPTTSHAWECVISSGGVDVFYSSDTDDTGVQGPGATTCWIPGSTPLPFWFDPTYTGDL